MIETARSVKLLDFEHWVDSSNTSRHVAVHRFTLHRDCNGNYIVIDLDSISVLQIGREYAENLVLKYCPEEFSEIFNVMR